MNFFLKARKKGGFRNAFEFPSQLGDPLEGNS